MQTIPPLATPPVRRRRQSWVRANLFSSRPNSALTIATLAAIALIVFFLLQQDFFDLDFSVVEVNRRLLFVGRYPQSEEWRLWPPLWLAFTLGGFSFGFWARLGRRDALWLGAALVFIFALLAHGQNGALFGGAVASAAIAYALARRIRRSPSARSRAIKLLVGGWLRA